jgi:hypothetical protein
MADCRFGLAEVLQNWAENVITATAAAPAARDAPPGTAAALSAQLVAPAGGEAVAE